jgi:hypothetical protein
MYAHQVLGAKYMYGTSKHITFTKNLNKSWNKYVHQVDTKYGTSDNICTDKKQIKSSISKQLRINQADTS